MHAPNDLRQAKFQTLFTEPSWSLRGGSREWKEEDEEEEQQQWQQQRGNDTEDDDDYVFLLWRI